MESFCHDRDILFPGRIWRWSNFHSQVMQSLSLLDPLLPLPSYICEQLRHLWYRHSVAHFSSLGHSEEQDESGGKDATSRNVVRLSESAEALVFE